MRVSLIVRVSEHESEREGVRMRVKVRIIVRVRVIVREGPLIRYGGVHTQPAMALSVEEKEMSVELTGTQHTQHAKR